MYFPKVASSTNPRPTGSSNPAYRTVLFGARGKLDLLAFNFIVITETRLEEALGFKMILPGATLSRQKRDTFRPGSR